LFFIFFFRPLLSFFHLIFISRHFSSSFHFVHHLFIFYHFVHYISSFMFFRYLVCLLLKHNVYFLTRK
jgi:hypothetical protein